MSKTQDFVNNLVNFENAQDAIQAALIQAVQDFHQNNGDVTQIAHVYNGLKASEFDTRRPKDAALFRGFINKFAPSQFKKVEGEILWDAEKQEFTLLKDRKRSDKLLEDCGTTFDAEDRWDKVKAVIDAYLSERKGSIFGKVKKEDTRSADEKKQADIADFKGKKTDNFIKAAGKLELSDAEKKDILLKMAVNMGLGAIHFANEQ